MRAWAVATLGGVCVRLGGLASVVCACLWAELVHVHILLAWLPHTSHPPPALWVAATVLVRLSLKLTPLPSSTLLRPQTLSHTMPMRIGMLMMFFSA